MTRIFSCAMLLLFISSCSNNAAKTDAEPAKIDSTSTAAAPAENIDYAYLPANHGPDNWDRGDQKNIAITLKALKAFEMGNVDESMTYFGDSVSFATEGLVGKFSKDSLATLLKGFRGALKSLTIKMSDYESVISKDKKDEYVGLWYKEVFTDMKGKTDSSVKMDDVKLQNGKIVEIDEKSRSFNHLKKK